MSGESSSSLVEVVYASGATCKFSPEDLAELLKKARANNEKLGVSGLLLFIEGSFLQVLEGPATAVDYLFRKIGEDARHNNVLTLRKTSIEERSFSDWRMGCAALRPSQLQEVPGLSEFLVNGKLHVADVDADGDRLRKVLDAFRDGRYRRHVSDGS